MKPVRWITRQFRPEDADETEPAKTATRLSEATRMLTAAQDKTLEAIEQILSDDHPGPTGNVIEDMARGYYRVRETTKP